jgi:hypothetical protein
VNCVGELVVRMRLVLVLGVLAVIVVLGVGGFVYFGDRGSEGSWRERVRFFVGKLG